MDTKLSFPFVMPLNADQAEENLMKGGIPCFQRYSPFVFIILIMSLTACSSTTMTSTWKDPDSQPLHFQKGNTVIALVMSPNEGVGRSAEDALAKELTSRGIIEGVPAYTIIPIEDLRNETQAKAHINWAVS